MLFGHLWRWLGCQTFIDILCQGGSLGAGHPLIPLDEDLAAVWRELVAELGYAGDDDGLLGLVHVVLGWAPDGDTPVRVLG